MNKKPEESSAAEKKDKKAKKKNMKGVTSGIVHIQATFNNTIMSIADRQ